MIKYISALKLLGLLALVAGCGSKPTTFIPPVPPAVPMHTISNPEYENWNKFPVGTKVVRKKEITNSEGTVTVTTTLTLRAKTDRQLDVESQIHVVRPDSIQDNPPQLFEFAAEFEVPETMDREAFVLPSPTAKKVATEKIEVCGQLFEADIYEWEGQLEMGKVDLKLWRSNNFPGRQIKMLTGYPDPSLTGIEETIELHIPQAEEKISAL